MFVLSLWLDDTLYKLFLSFQALWTLNCIWVKGLNETKIWWEIYFLILDHTKVGKVYYSLWRLFLILLLYSGMQDFTWSISTVCCCYYCLSKESEYFFHHCLYVNVSSAAPSWWKFVMNLGIPSRYTKGTLPSQLFLFQYKFQYLNSGLKGIYEYQAPIQYQCSLFP